MADLSDYGIEFDDDGRLVGFQAGKAAALLDWEHRKEAKEFMRLWRRLYSRKWTGANREKIATQRQARRALNLEAQRLYMRLYMRSFNARRRRAITKPCAFCGKKWTAEPTPGMPRERTAHDKKTGPLKGQRMKRWGIYCSRRCQGMGYNRDKKKRLGLRDRNKLTMSQVLVIRDRAANGERRIALAREFGISKSQVFSILAGRSWRDVQVQTKEQAAPSETARPSKGKAERVASAPEADGQPRWAREQRESDDDPGEQEAGAVRRGTVAIPGRRSGAIEVTRRSA